MKKSLRTCLALLMLFCLCISLLPVSGLAESLFSLHIRYLNEDGMQIAPSFFVSLPAGSEYSVPSPQVEHYLLTDNAQQTLSGTLNKDTQMVVTYRWSAQTASYTINYWGVDLEATHPTLLHTVTGQGIIGSLVQAEEKQFDGYTRMAGNLSLLITPDGKAELDISYEENVDPSIVFHTGGSYVPPIVAPAGTDISRQVASLPVPTKHGWAFKQWDTVLPGVMPDEMLRVNAVWEPALSNYTVHYYFQHAEDDGYTRNEGLDVTRQALTNSTVTATAGDIAYGEIENDDKNPFYGFEYERCEDAVVTDDDEAVLNIYYKREIWTVKFYDVPFNGHDTMTEADLPEDKLWKTFSGRFGSPYPDDYPTSSEIAVHMNALERDTAAGVPFDHMVCPLRSTSQLQNSSSFTSFVDQSSPGSHTLLLVPYYHAGLITRVMIRYCQKVGCESAEQMMEDNSWEIFDQKIFTNSAANYFMTIRNMEGFTAERQDVPGEDPVCIMYRTGATQEECEKAEWIQLTPSATTPEKPHTAGMGWTWNKKYTPPRSCFELTGWTEIRFLRVISPIIYEDDGVILKQTEKIGYETPLAEYLAWQPEVPEGKKFDGWYLSPDDFEHGEPVKSSMTMPPNALYLYAKFTEDIQHTVTFQSRGGTEVETQIVPHLQQASEPLDPVKEGSIFKGWFLADDTPWAFDREVEKDTVLYAHWQPIKRIPYVVKHLRTDTNTVFYEQHSTGTIGDTVTASALTLRDPAFPKDIYLEPEAPTRSMTLSDDTHELIFSYYPGDFKKYTVSYLEEGTDKPLHKDKNVAKTMLSQVTENALAIRGYEVETPKLTMTLTAQGENHLIFYYQRLPGVEIPDTGDESHPGLWLALALTGCVLLTVLLRKGKKPAPRR